MQQATMLDIPQRSGAVLSPCGTYRYSLTRAMASRPGQRIVWVMLNPSTADANLDDPTIRRIRNFSLGWLYGTLEVVNLFAYRATKPKVLKQATDPVGPENDAHILRAVENCKTVVAAWGGSVATWPPFKQRVRWLADTLRYAGVTLQCLGETKDGHPLHPLYVPGESCLMPTWSGQHPARAYNGAR